MWTKIRLSNSFCRFDSLIIYWLSQLRLAFALSLDFGEILGGFRACTTSWRFVVSPGVWRSFGETKIEPYVHGLYLRFLSVSTFVLYSYTIRISPTRLISPLISFSPTDWTLNPKHLVSNVCYICDLLSVPCNVYSVAICRGRTYTNSSLSVL